ncbi:MAG TPA: ATP-binding protein, partial [Chloroflexia bacterium]
RQREETLAGIISASPDIITILDTDGHIHSTSPATLDILGYSPEERQGKNILQFTHEGDRKRLSSLLRATATGHLQSLPLRHRYRHANGDWVLLESNSRLLTDNRGQFSGAVVISRDVTEQAKVEEELHQAKEEADRANRAKSEFLSRMSHELRTPLNAILGFTQLLEMDSTTDDQRESVAHILKAGHHLLNLINEILDLSRIEEGRLQMSIEPVLVEEVVQEVLDLVKRQAQQRDITFQVPEPGMSRHYVLADRQRLMQVLLNLVSNAVKYNREDGSIAISCDELAGDKLRLNVIDTGLGLNPDQVERLFMPFERLGAEQSAIEGTGLGLALSKRLVEAMQGSMEVTSSVGQGSTFSVVLASTEGRVQSLERVASELVGVPQLHTEERQVLYIEDNLSNLKLIERILERRTNIRLLSAMQGGLGLELAREQQPDLIMLDLHLPDMHGDEVLQRLKAAPETAGIPVVILSADATPRQVERLLAAGARAYLTKPLDVKQLIGVLEETLNAEKGT